MARSVRTGGKAAGRRPSTDRPPCFLEAMALEMTRRLDGWTSCGFLRPRTNGFLNPVNAASRIAFDLVFPYPNDAPACSTEPMKIAVVTPSVTFDLLLPVRSELSTPTREPPAVPVISVDEDDDFRIDEDEVWSSREAAPMFAKPKATSMKQPTNSKFRSSVLAADQRHGATALLRREIVHRVSGLRVYDVMPS